LAFLPIRERPLSVWFLAFIRAIYAPTIYVYKEKGAEEVFRENGQSPEIEIVTPMGAQRAEEYLHQIPKTSVEEKFDKSEESLLARVSSFFHANSPSQSSSPFPTQTISAPQVAPVKAPQEDRDRAEKVVKIMEENGITKIIPEHKKFLSLILIRFFVPFDVVNYLLGLFTKINLKTFFLSTLISTIPLTLILVYIGTLPVGYQIISLIIFILFVVILGIEFKKINSRIKIYNPNNLTKNKRVKNI